MRLEAPLHMHAFTLGPSAACYISLLIIGSADAMQAFAVIAIA